MAKTNKILTAINLMFAAIAATLALNGAKETAGTIAGIAACLMAIRLGSEKHWPSTVDIIASISWFTAAIVLPPPGQKGIILLYIIVICTFLVCIAIGAIFAPKTPPKNEEEQRAEILLRLAEAQKAGVPIEFGRHISIAALEGLVIAAERCIKEWKTLKAADPNKDKTATQEEVIP